MNRKFIILTVLFIVIIISLNSFELKEVLSIGSDKPNYEFFRIKGVNIDDYGNIYVADFKGCFIREYSKDGKFIAETGKCGQGPGEFLFGTNVILNRNEVIVYDMRNKKILFYENKYLHYLKEKKVRKGRKGLLLGKSGFYTYGINFQDDNVIAKIDNKGNLVKSFFDLYPSILKNVKKDKYYYPLKAMIKDFKIDYNKVTDEFVICFSHYYRGAKLYIIDSEGRIKKEINLTIDNKYKFPEFLLGFPINFPSAFRIIMIDSVHFYKNKYIVIEYKDEEVKEERKKDVKKLSAYIEIIEIKDGKLLGKRVVKSGMRIFKIVGDYIYAKDFDDDIEKLHIFKIERIVK